MVKKTARTAKKATRVAKKAVGVAKKATRVASKAGKAPRKAGARSRTWLKLPKDVTEDDVRYVVERGVDDANSFLSSAQSWLAKLARRIRLAYDMLVAWWTGRFEFPKATVAALTLALLYFINPFDIIPDVLPLIGVVDDAMVFALVTRLMSADAKRYAKKFGLKLADVGL